MNDPQVPVLDYAARPRWFRRRWLRRARIVLVTCVVIGVAVKWGPTAWERVRLVWVFNQCMSYRAPADMIVYSTVAGDAKGLPLRDSQYADLSTPQDGAWVVHEPAVLTRLMPGLSLLPLSRGVLLMHERRTKGGQSRLVIVRGGSIGFSGVTWPTGLQSAAVEAPSPIAGWKANSRVIYLAGAAPVLRYFAGQPDPSDPSHFTIRYQADGANGTIDGWLEEDAQSVRIEFRDGPLASRQMVAEFQMNVAGRSPSMVALSDLRLELNNSIVSPSGLAPTTQPHAPTRP